ncbi:MAG: HYC_CC_PP family protein [Daejeonella sp.]|uniref:HYC_CC_PP family protein n=1 Tax=Daejeonella sp. JGW-45 TaxID=3034148 RepID=UPI0023EC1BE2|nr:hypothetical protein [Daejeonella sp. JGW-45]
MKRFFITVLAVFYLGVSSEATVHIHYCMGELIDLSFSSDKTEKCGNCGMDKSSSENCCKHLQHKFKVKDSLTASKVGYHFTLLGIEVPSKNLAEIDELPISSLDKVNVFNAALNRTQATPAFILYCNFRI